MAKKEFSKVAVEGQEVVIHVKDEEARQELENCVCAPGQRVLAQALAALFAAIDGLKAQLDNLGETKAVSIDFEEQPKLCGQPLVIEGSGAPAAPVVPTMVGQRYHDTTNRKVYEAFAVTNSVSDWVLLN